MESMFGIGKENRPKDIKKLRKILDEYFAKKGEERDPEKSNSGEVDPDLVLDIQRYQKANNLKVDGIIHPGGETEKSMQSHPGKPGPDLPVVMPGPAQPEPKDMSQKCLDLNTKKEDMEFKYGELSKKIKQWNKEAKTTVADLQDGPVLTSDVIAVVSGGTAILSAIAAVTASGIAAATSAALAPILGAIAVIEGVKVIYNKLYTLNERLADAAITAQRYEQELKALDLALERHGCP